MLQPLKQAKNPLVYFFKTKDSFKELSAEEKITTLNFIIKFSREHQENKKIFLLTIYIVTAITTCIWEQIRVQLSFFTFSLNWTHCIVKLYFRFTTARKRQACENKKVIQNKKNLCRIADFVVSLLKKFSKLHIVKPYVLHYQNHHTDISCNTIILDFNHSLATVCSIFYCV